MRKRTKIAIGATVAGVAIATGTGIAVAGSGDDDDTQRPITGEELDHASAAALDFTGGGRVTETEVDDEESYYEVEVTLDDGSQVDVQLDRDFQVVGSERDEADDDHEGGVDDD